MNSISERDIQVIWHPYTQMKTSEKPVAIVKGDGAYIFDENGNRYIDAISSWWVNTHGHSNKYIASKIAEQMAQLEHVIFAGFTHKPAVELAERLLQHLPQNQKKIFYSDNGSTAVEVALKMAIQYWSNQNCKKQKIIALQNAYHGDTFGSMSVSGRSVFTAPFSDLLFDIEFIDVPVKGKEEISLMQLQKAAESNDVAAFIFEPLVQGAGGMVMYEPEILDKLLGVCIEKNIITIADEVMTGFYRTGTFFATDRLKNKPDIICMSKGITGGFMAMGVTSCNLKIFEAFLSDDKTKTLYHGHSYTGNPIACAAALASLDLYENDSLEEDVLRISFKQEVFKKQIQHYQCVSEARSTGTILAIELKTPEGTSYLSNVRNTIYDFFMDKGIILRPLGNVLYVLPPYCISDDDLDYVHSSIIDFLESYNIS